MEYSKRKRLIVMAALILCLCVVLGGVTAILVYVFSSDASTPAESEGGSSKPMTDLQKSVLMNWTVSDSRNMDTKRASSTDGKMGPFYAELSDQVEKTVFPAGQIRFIELEDFLNTGHLTGKWGVNTNSQYSGGSALQLISKEGSNGSLTLSFSGTGIAVYGVCGSTSSQLSWSLDNGVQSGTENLFYSDGYRYQDRLIAISGLEPGTHTLVISDVAKGYQKNNPWETEFKIVLDFAVVENGGILSKELDKKRSSKAVPTDGGLRLEKGGSVTGVFMGDNVTLNAKGNGRLKIRVDAKSEEAEVPAEMSAVYQRTGMSRGDKDLKRMHTYTVECLEGYVILGDMEAESYQYAKDTFVELTLDGEKAGCRAGVVLLDSYAFRDTSLHLEAYDKDGNKLADGKDWFLNIGEAGKATRLRVTFETDAFCRAPYIETLYVVSASVTAEAPSGRYIGFEPGTIKEAEQTNRNGVGNFAWFPRPGQFPVDEWSRVNKIDIFINAAVMRDAGKAFMLSMRHGFGDYTRPTWLLKDGDWAPLVYPDIYTQEELEALKTLGGPYFIGLLMEEMDTTLLQGGLGSQSRNEIPDLYDFTTRSGGRAAVEKELKKYVDRYHSYGLPAIVNYATMFQHSGYRAGADLVIGEFGAQHVSYGVQLAMLRGASRQFDKDFGVWISLWHNVQLPVPEQSPAAGKHPGMSEQTGHSANRLRQTMLLSYLSGAQIVTTEDTVPMFVGDSMGDWDLSEWGNVVKEVESKKDTLDAYSPDVRTALMLDKDAGWTPGSLWGGWPTWTSEPFDNGSQYGHIWGKLKAETPELQEMAVFNMLYPGSSDSGIMLYEGTYTDTPYGPVNVVQSDISLDALCAYDRVIVSGYFNPTQKEFGVLKQYVQQGGHLLINAEQAATYWRDSEFWGGTVSPATTAVSGAAMNGTSYTVSTDIHGYSGTASALIMTSSGPLAVENAVGSGSVVLTLTDQYDLAAAQQPELLPYYGDLLRYMIGKGGAYETGAVYAKGLQYLHLKKEGKPALFLTNNSKTPITVTVKANGTVEAAVDTLTGHTYSGRAAQSQTVFTIALDAYQNVLLDF